MSVRPSTWKNSAPTGQIFLKMKFGIWVLLEKLLWNIKFPYDLRRIAVLHMNSDIHLWSYLAQFFLEWQMFRQNRIWHQNTHFVFGNLFFRKSWPLWECEIKWSKWAKQSEVEWGEVKCSIGNGEGGGRVFMKKVYRSSKWWEVKDWGESVSELMIGKITNHNKLYTVLSWLGVFTFCACCKILICIVCIVASFKLSCV